MKILFTKWIHFSYCSKSRHHNNNFNSAKTDMLVLLGSIFCIRWHLEALYLPNFTGPSLCEINFQ